MLPPHLKKAGLYIPPMMGQDGNVEGRFASFQNSEDLTLTKPLSREYWYDIGKCSLPDAHM